MQEHEEALIELSGMEMHYRIFGAGEPVLLLHGFFKSGAMWDPYIPHLADHFRVIVLDLRGHGASTNPTGRYTHRQAGQDVLALMDHFDVDWGSAIGHSTGAIALLHACTAEPDRFESLILASVGHYASYNARELLRNTPVENISAEIMAKRLKFAVHGEKQVQTLHSNFRDLADVYDDPNFTPPLLGTIAARTLLVHGDRDPQFPLELVLELYRSIPNASLWTLPNAGHALFGRELPRFPGGDPFATVAADFLLSRF
jgi:pimeloyl-ACP methyl ester carboxylesterase